MIILLQLQFFSNTQMSHPDIQVSMLHLYHLFRYLDTMLHSALVNKTRQAFFKYNFLFCLIIAIKQFLYFITTSSSQPHCPWRGFDRINYRLAGTMRAIPATQATNFTVYAAKLQSNMDLQSVKRPQERASQIGKVIQHRGFRGDYFSFEACERKTPLRHRPKYGQHATLGYPNLSQRKLSL